MAKLLLLRGILPANVGRDFRDVSTTIRSISSIAGFLSDQQYGSLICNADIVLTLTTQDHTMLRGAWEPIYQATPVIVSDWPILQSSFDKGQSQCACGMAHSIIREVTGRIGQKIVGVTRQYPSLTLYYVFKNLAQERQIILNYQAIQDRPGFVRLDIEQNLVHEERQHLIAECQKYFSDDISFDINEGSDLRSPSRKKRDFVSSLEG